MPGSSPLWPTVGSIVSGSIGVLLQLALLLLALTVVRKQSPSGSVLMAASAVLMMLLTIAYPIAYTALARVAKGVESYVATSSIPGIAVSLARAAGFLLLLAGIYKTATDGHSS